MRRLHPIAVTGILAAVVAFATWPQVLQISRGVTDFGDPLLNSWILAWVAHAVLAAPGHLFDANIFFPEGTTLAYSEALLLPGLAVAPINWLGATPALAHNVALLGGYVLSGLAVFVLVRRHTGHDGAALVAAVTFAVYPYRAEHYARVQNQLTFWWPLALLSLDRLAQTPTPRWTLLLALCVAADFYTSVYNSVLGALALMVVAVMTVVLAPGSRRVPVARSLALAAVAALVLAMPLAGRYAAAAEVVGTRPLAAVERGSAELADYRRAHPENWLYGNDAHPGPSERRLFPGYGAPLLALAAFVPPVNTVALAYGAAAVVAFDLSLGTHAPGYRWLYDWAAPMRALRVPARLGMYVGLMIATLAGLGVARLARGRSPRVQVALVATALVVVATEGRMRPQVLVALDETTPAVYLWLARQRAGVVCEYPVGNLEGRAGPQDATYMYYSTIHWQPLVNGYSGFAPPSYVELLDRLGDFPDDRSIDYLRARRVTYLLVHQKFYIHGDYAADVRALRARQDLRWLGTFRWRSGASSDAFAIGETTPGNVTDGPVVQ